MPIRTTLICAAAAMAASLTAGIAFADAGSQTRSDPGCFPVNEWSGWSSPSPTVIYLRVNSDIYEVDLSAGSDELQEPDMHLVNQVHGSDWICSPVDLQLAIADEHGEMREGLIVKSISKLTPEQVKAIPPKFRP